MGEYLKNGLTCLYQTWVGMSVFPRMYILSTLYTKCGLLMLVFTKVLQDATDGVPRKCYLFQTKCRSETHTDVSKCLCVHSRERLTVHFVGLCLRLNSLCISC